MYAYKKLPSTEADLMDKRGLLLLKIEGEKRKEAEEEDTDGVEFDKRQIDGGHRKVPEKAIVFAQMNELLRQDDNSRNNEVKFLDACVSGWVGGTWEYHFGLWFGDDHWVCWILLKWFSKNK